MEKRLVNSADMRTINYYLVEADSRRGRKFSSGWRTSICATCTKFPFSTLRRAFRERYGAITEEGEQSVPLNNSTHHHHNVTNENNSHSDSDMVEADNNNIPDLDSDATREIFRKLPVPSSMRAKAVCKAWNGTISSTNLNFKEYFVIQQSHERIAFFCAELNRWFEIHLPLNKHTWERNKCYTSYPCKLHLCAAASGLFFFHHWSSEPIIFNLLTKQHRFLPPLEGCLAGDAVELKVEEGRFQVITLTPDHKVRFYDSNRCGWKDISVRIDFLEARRMFQQHTHPWKSALHNGMAYFTNDFGRHLGCYDFDRRELQFKEVAGGPPPKIDFDDHDNNYYASLPCLVSCNGKLLLVGRLEKAGGGLEGSIWGVIPFIEHALVGIWELEFNESWSLLSVAPQALVKDTVKSSHGTDFMVAASSDNIWLTIRGSVNILTFDLRSMEWNVLLGCPAEDLVDTNPKKAFFVPFSISPPYKVCW